MTQALENVRIVLVGTTHSGNIGSSARAMKTMGLSDLHVVNPCKFSARNGDAHALASGALDVLSGAQRHTDLASAISDCGVVIGASARLRASRWPQLDPVEAAEKLLEYSENQPVALVFGRERSGLSNDELDHCQYLTHINANPEYSSLNLAMAVQVYAYTLRMQFLNSVKSRVLQSPETDTMHPDDVPATAGELNFLFTRLEKLLDKVDFLFQQDPQYMVRKIKRMIYRAELEHKEVNIVQGILTSIENKINKLETQLSQNTTESE
ncbi:MAG: RNA methyltransferase [Gammaproteobacteria bacterium]|nr:RNA methyltransferase [Gammaproteobacteria bacterium]NNM13526.1 RNA methyltransferase [Gammaproteobacteria bacterium]